MTNVNILVIAVQIIYDVCGGDGGGGGGTESCENCEFDFTPYGSECCDTAWDEYGIDCATLESVYYWDCSGCTCPGDLMGTGTSNEVTEIMEIPQDRFENNSVEGTLLNKMAECSQLLDLLIDLGDTQSNREYELIATLAGTSYVDADVVNGNNYCYYVIASNVSGESDASNTDCAEPYGLNAATNLVCNR